MGFDKWGELKKFFQKCIDDKDSPRELDPIYESILNIMEKYEKYEEEDKEG